MFGERFLVLFCLVVLWRDVQGRLTGDKCSTAAGRIFAVNERWSECVSDRPCCVYFCQCLKKDQGETRAVCVMSCPFVTFARDCTAPPSSRDPYSRCCYVQCRGRKEYPAGVSIGWRQKNSNFRNQ